jgi:glycosyltransferase involved in cell wall biosynthesis
MDSEGVPFQQGFYSVKHLVSVIIPCFNGRDLVGTAIESVLSQEGVDLEVIAVDDGSIDGTRKVLESFGDRIRRIYQENRGAASARNSGLSIARGEFIAFLDCDDVWLPGKIKRQLECFDKRPEVGLVFTDSEVFSEEGTVIPSKKALRPVAEGWVLKELFRDNFISTPCVMVRRNCLQKVGGFREDYQNAEDYDLWMRLAAEYPFGYLDEVLVRIRLREGSLNENFENRFVTDIKIVNEWIMNRPDLFPVGSRIVRERLGRLYFKVGRGCLHAGRSAGAREYLVQSIKYNPLNSRPWTFLMASLLPRFALKWLRNRGRKRRPGDLEKWARIAVWTGILVLGSAGFQCARAAGKAFHCGKIETSSPVSHPDPSRFSEAERERGFVVFKKGNFEPLYPNSIPPAESLNTLSLSATPGEFEPVAFGLYPLRDIKKVRFKILDLIREDEKTVPSSAIGIRIARVQTLPLGALTINRSVGACGPIPYVLMPETETFLRAGETKWIWLTVAVPSDAAPGEYRSEIGIVPEKGKGLSVPMRLTIYPFHLDPSPVQYLMLYETSFLGLSKVRNAVEHQRILRKAEILYRDMRDHGMTAVSPVETEAFDLGADGKPKFPVTRASLDMAQRVGMRGMPVINIAPLARTEKKKHRWNYTEYDPSIHPDRVKRMVQAVTEWADAKGWGPVAFSPIDEPTHPERSRIGAQVLRAVKKVKGARTFLACKPDSLAPLQDWVDVVDFNAERFTVEARDRIKKNGKPVWIYGNGIVFGTDPVNSRFSAGFYAWKAGLDGVTAWTYPLSGKRSMDRVTGWRPPEIASDGKPVPTVVWEALREGIDDRRYIETLEQSIRKAQKDGKSEAAANGKETLNHVAEQMQKAYIWYSGNKKGPYRGGLKMPMLDKAREKIAHEIAVLSRMQGKSP